MENSYNVDDILSEIKKKKSQNIASQKPSAEYGVASATVRPTESAPAPTAPEKTATQVKAPVHMQEPEQPQPTVNPSADDVLDVLKTVIAQQEQMIHGAAPSPAPEEPPKKPRRQQGLLPERDMPPAQPQPVVETTAKEPDIPLAEQVPVTAPKKKDFQLNLRFDDNDFGTMNTPSEDNADGLTKAVNLSEISGKIQRPSFSDLKQIDDEDEEEETVSRIDDEDDFNSPEDVDDIESDLYSIRMRLYMKGILTTIVFAISLYLALSYLYPLPLPKMIFPETDMRLFMITNLCVGVVASLICGSTVGRGFLSLLKLQANEDSLPALAMLAAVGQGVAFVVKPEAFTDSQYHLFYPVAILCLIFNILGKIMMMGRIHRNFRLVSSEKPKKAVLMMKNRELVQDLTRGMDLDDFRVAYGVRTKFLSNFLRESYSEDQSEIVHRLVAPICLVGALIVSVLTYFFKKDIFFALTAFAAILCVCAPFTSTIAASLPLARLSKKLAPKGAYVAGYQAVSDFADTECIIIHDVDLFKPQNVVLHGIKAFEQSRIDEAILDAASVICEIEGTLSSVFTQIIGNNKKILKKVDSIVYEDAMGLSAWVDGKRVLIGNRELMINHGVSVPGKDYEQRFTKDGRNVIYLANSGELTSMFVISYRVSEETQDEIDKLESQGMNLIIYTSDPNITAEKVAEVYEYPLDMIRIMPAKLHKAYEKEIKEKETAKGQIGFLGKPETMLRAIAAASNVKLSVISAVVIQMIGTLLGYGLITFVAFLGTLSKISFLSLIIYQLFWTVAVMIVPNMKRL